MEPRRDGHGGSRESGAWAWRPGCGQLGRAGGDQSLAGMTSQVSYLCSPAVPFSRPSPLRAGGVRESSVRPLPGRAEGDMEWTSDKHSRNKGEATASAFGVLGRAFYLALSHAVILNHWTHWNQDQLWTSLSQRQDKENQPAVQHSPGSREEELPLGVSFLEHRLGTSWGHMERGVHDSPSQQRQDYPKQRCLRGGTDGTFSRDPSPGIAGRAHTYTVSFKLAR